MRSLFSYLIVMFIALFWILRVVVTLAATAGASFVLTPLNTNIEIILLFVTLVCFALIVKRNILGAVLYLISYGLYFGVDLYNNTNNLLNGGEAASGYLSLFVSAIAIILALTAFFDIAITSNKKGGSPNKKTDWFYGTDEYQRQKDSRDDNNEYHL
ncbi:MAG: hypothetical protein FWC53_04335 [Firmicutes bacterium]|nr:hypothetical protein [Bacillota bacterium]